MNTHYKKAARELIDIPSSLQIIKEAFGEINFREGERIWWFISLILSTWISWRICFSYNTVEFTRTIINDFITIQLALFGIVFTVFSIILAFFNDNMLKILSAKQLKHKEESALKTYLTYYEKVLFLYFVNISITFVIKMFVGTIGNDFIIYNKIFSDILSFVILLTYYTFSIRVFFEIKSIIYNTISLFRINLSYKFIDFLEQDKDEKR